MDFKKKLRGNESGPKLGYKSFGRIVQGFCACKNKPLKINYGFIQPSIDEGVQNTGLEVKKRIFLSIILDPWLNKILGDSRTLGWKKE